MFTIIQKPVAASALLVLSMLIIGGTIAGFF